MASVLIKRGKWWFRVKGNKTPGKWSTHPCPADVKTREDAEFCAASAQAAIDKRRGIKAPGSVTLRDWAKTWLRRREEAGQDWKKDRGRLENHVLPVLGGIDLPDITAAHVADLVHALRFTKKLANRTARNVYSTLSACLRDARIAGKIQQSPCILTDTQLGPIVDKDPEWRSGAQYTRKEAATMISEPRIPMDRRMVYALSLLAGLRPGEAAALRWRNYDATWEIMGKLTVARAYSTSYSVAKGTKTNAVKFIPVHPVLADMLAEWRLGWAAMFGREPTDDDLIVPLPPKVKRTKRTGDRFRGWDYSGRRWRDEDLPMLGWRARSYYDTRATFITLALEDGADRDILRTRVTHTPAKRDAFDGYDRGVRWAETCREVSKLRLARFVPGMYPEKSSTGNGLRRRVSKAQPEPPVLRVIQGGREVIPTEHDLARTLMGTCVYPRENEASDAKVGLSK